MLPGRIRLSFMSRKVLIPTLLVFALFGVVIPWIVIANNRAPSAGGGGGTAAAPTAAAGGTTTSGGAAAGGGKKATGGKKTAGTQQGGAAAQLAQGKTLFQQNCGTCHTLANAGTNGKIGPVLDQVKPDMQRVLNAIKNGGLGSGTMPTNIVTGKDAQAVAKYVSTVAGK